MKLTKRQLRDIIREVAEPSYGLADRYAIITSYNSPIFTKLGGEGRINFGLFNAVKTLNSLRHKDTDYHNVGEAIVDNIKAILTLSTAEHKYFNQNGAYSVARSAAESSFGPTLYDMVMSVLPNGLTPDRNTVSPSAESVWSFYANRRPDVEKSFLDDVRDPITPNKDDDTFIRPTAKPAKPRKNFKPTYEFDSEVQRGEYLNMSYNIKSRSAEYDLLVDNFAIFLDALEKISPDTNDAIAAYHKYKDDDMNLALNRGTGFNDATEMIVGAYFKSKYNE